MKVRVIRFESELDFENTTALIDILDKCLHELNYDKIKIYLSSVGGDVYNMNMLAGYVNLNSDKIDLHINGEVASGAFHLCLLFKGNVFVEYSSNAIAHIPAIAESRGINTKGTVNNFYAEDLKECLDEWIEEYSGLLTEKELIKMRKGFDIYIGYYRLLEFFGGRNDKR